MARYRAGRATARPPASHLPHRPADLLRPETILQARGAHDPTMDDGSAGVKDSRGSRESRTSLLAEVTALMGSGLEQTQLLFRLAHLVVPALGDLCAIDFFHEPDVIVRMAYAHVDADKKPLVNEVRAAHGFNVDSPHGVPAALRTHRSIVIPRVT